MGARLALVVAFLCQLSPLAGWGATRTWDGGGQDLVWQNAANWSGNLLPANGDDVVIGLPAGQVVEFSSGTVRLRSLQATSGFRLKGGTFGLTAGSSTIGGGLVLEDGVLEISGTGTTLTPGGAVTHLGASITVSGGATLRLAGLTQLGRPVNGGYSFSSTGAGSLIDLPNVVSTTVQDYYRASFSASSGGRILLPKLAQIDGALGATATDTGSVVDLSGVKGIWALNRPGTAALEASTGGSVLIPNVTGLTGVNLALSGKGQINTAQLTSLISLDLFLDGVTNNFPALTNIDGINITLNRRARATLAGVTQLHPLDTGNLKLEVVDVGSELSLPNLTVAEVMPYYRLLLQARSGGRLLAPKLAALNGGIDAFAEGEGSIVDLPSFVGTLGNPQPGSAYIQSRDGGGVLISNVTRLEGINLTLRNNSRTPTAQLRAFIDGELTVSGVTNTFPGLTNIDGSSIYLDGKARVTLAGIQRMAATGSGSLKLQVSDAGSQLSLPNLVSAAVEDYYRFQTYAYSGGRLTLPKLLPPDAAIDAYASGAGSLVELPSLTGLLRNDTPGTAYIESRDGGGVLIPNVTGLEGIDLTVRGSSTLTPTAQIRSLTDSTLTIDGAIGNFSNLSHLDHVNILLDSQATLVLDQVTELRSTQSGSMRLEARDSSLLRLPNLQRFDIAQYYRFQLYAYGGSRLELPQLASLGGALDVYADGVGTVVDLSGIRGRLDTVTSTQAYLEARTGGAIWIPNVTEIDGFTVRVQGNGTLPTAQLKRITDSVVTIDGAELAFPALTDVTGTRFDYLNGGTAFFQPPVDFIISDIRIPATAVANQAVELSWEVTNRGTTLTNGVWSTTLLLSSNAQTGGDIFLGTVSTTGGLAANASLRVTNSFVFPASLAGTWWVVAAANSTRTVFEGTNYGNNTNITVGSLKIVAPDLVVESVTLTPGTAKLGDPVSLNWRVRNAGLATALGNWVDRIELGTSSNGFTSIAVLGEEPVTLAGGLAPGATYTTTRSVTIPFISPPTAGAFVARITADGRDSLNESVETNNSNSAPITLSLPPLPDLAVTTIVAPTTLSPGQTAEFSWGVTNRGTASAVGPWTEQLYLVARTRVSNSVPIATITLTNTLAPGAFLIRTQRVTLPKEMVAGATPVTVVVDSGLEVPDPVRSNNTGSVTASPKVPLLLTLQLPVDSVSEGAIDPRLIALVKRNDDLSGPLTVSIAVSDPARLKAPASVTFAAGVGSIPLELQALPDGIPTLNKSVTVTVSAPTYLSGSGVVNVLNADLPKFLIQLSAQSVREGGGVTAVVSHNLSEKPAVNVTLAATGNGRLSLPASVVIPAGASSVSFPVGAVEDSKLDIARAFLIEASAGGFTAGSAALEVVDNDLLRFTLQLAETTVSEGAGPAATTLTVARDSASPRSLFVELVNSNPLVASIPTTVTIPGGASSVSVPVGAVNNALVDGPKVATFTAFALATASGERVAQAVPVALTLTDDDGPALQLTLGRELVAEGLPSATSLTITRNTAATQPLLVTLVSSLPTEATVQASVTLPAGQTNIVVPVSSIDDHVVDGTKSVRLTASAAGYVSGDATLLVTDVTLPDLLVAEETAPAVGDTEGFVNLGYRVLNQGLAPAGTNWITRIFLSPDPVVGDDAVLVDYAFNGTLPVGQYFSQTRQVRLPQAAGDYWMVVTTDVDGRIDEIIKQNNTTISSRPIRVTPAYSAKVEATLDSAVAGTAVPLQGTAVNTSSGGPAPFVLVNIHVYLRGTHRVISALTDDQGKFATTFKPLPGEAGFYEIGATHPGVSVARIQDSFTLHGLKADAVSALRLAEGGSETFKVMVHNLGDRPLTGLTAAVVNQSSSVNLQVSLPSGANLPGLGSVELEVSVQGLLATIVPGDSLLRVTSSEGARADIPLSIAVESLRARLVATPAELFAGMKVGGQAFVEFEISNQGAVPTEPIDIALPGVTWMQVVTPNPIPSLPPGATNRVMLQLRPPADLPQIAYEGSLSFRAGNSTLSLPYTFRALSEAKGDLTITVVDEYTFYAEGAPKVAGASVEVNDAVSGVTVLAALSDAQGVLVIPQLPEGYYEIKVSAEKHKPFRGTTLVIAGKANQFQAFPRREAVRYIWKVIPTEVTDRTKITIETVFEAFVPMPVVTVDPPLIDLSEFTADVTQIDMRVENHGLIAAKEAKISFGTHPDWSLEPLIEELGDIPARSSFTIPVLVKRLRPGSPTSGVSLASIGLAAGGGGCSISGSCRFIVECGGGKLGGGAPIAVINASASGGCGGGGGGGGEPPGGSGGGRGGSGGGAPGDSSDSGASCDGCSMAMAKAIFDCALDFLINDALSCAKDSYACTSSLSSNGPTWGGAYDCFKAVTSCLEAAGKKIPLVGALKYIDCAVGILTACDSLGGGAGGGGGGGGGSGGGGGGSGGGNPPVPPAAWITRQQLLQASSPQRRIAALTLASNPNFASLPGSVQPLVLRMERAAKVLEPAIYLLGDDAWLRDDKNDGFLAWIAAFNLANSEASPEGARISTAERATLLSVTRPASVSVAQVQRTLDRWNRSMDYWRAGVFYLSQVPVGQSSDFIALDTWKTTSDAALEAFTASQSEGYVDPWDALQKFGGEYLKFLSEGDGGGVCAHVRLRLEQQAIVTREGFEASLDIINDSLTELTNIAVDLQVRRRDGRDATRFFAIRPPSLSGLSAIDGSGVVALGATGSAVWTLVATTDAVLDGPEEFLVAGMLRYRQDGLNISVPLAPASITVHPSPSLGVKYFHQRDVFADDPFTVEVEPSVPFSLAVMVQNKGRGPARDVRIDSAQPKIVENQKGLFADFKIIATEVAGQNLQPSLSVEFGEIAPGTNAIGRWLLTSTILGGFIDYSATFEHLDALGDKKLSLVEGVEIHELIHIVNATGDLEDGRPDFLVNDIADLYDRPDTLHLSDGSTRPVSVVLDGQVDRAPTLSDPVVHLTAKLPAGFAYLRIPDPGNGRLRLIRAVRSDGLEIHLGENVWTADRTFLGNARRPLVENSLHLFDRDSTGQYTLTYAPLPDRDEIPPTSSVASLPPDSSARIPVVWSGEDNLGGTGIQYFDVFVSIDGAPYVEWEHQTLDRSGVYTGALGKTYSFFSVATDNAGNREARPALADASTKVTRVNHAPVLESIADRVIKEGDTFTLLPLASDVDGDELVFSLNTNLPPNVVIQPYTGAIRWVTGEGSGGTVADFVLQVLDNGSPRLGAVQKFRVVVGSVNQPPSLAPIVNRRINEGSLLSVTNTATDPDLPKQALRFSLGAGAPSGVTIDPVTGVLQWRPTQFQGGTTNRIRVVVTDDGVPTLTSEQSFFVVVRDTLSDFGLTLGTTNLLVGARGEVPLILNSGGDLTQVTFDLLAADPHLTTLTLDPTGADVLSAGFESAGQGRYRVRLDFDPNQSQPGSRTVAHLHFTTAGTGHSSIAMLNVENLSVSRLSGEPLSHTSTKLGRLFLVEVEPLLDSQLLGDRIAITLYGIPGKRYMLQHSSALSGQPWLDDDTVTLVGDHLILEKAVGAVEKVFYRFVER